MSSVPVKEWNWDFFSLFFYNLIHFYLFSDIKKQISVFDINTVHIEGDYVHHGCKGYFVNKKKNSNNRSLLISKRPRDLVLERSKKKGSYVPGTSTN